MADFFISYNRHDRDWAEWIAWILEEKGYSLFIREWDLRPGQNPIIELDRALSEARRMIVVLSENYLESLDPPSEWAAVFAQDPIGKQRRLIPVRVRGCNPEGLLSQIFDIDLVCVSDEATAKKKLLDGMLERIKPPERPPFPLSVEHSVTSEKPKFPPDSQQPLVDVQNERAKVPEPRPFPLSMKLLMRLLPFGIGVFLLILVWMVYSWSQNVCDRTKDDHISCGEETLVRRQDSDPPEKQQGIDKFANGDYLNADRMLSQAWDKQHDKAVKASPDPETLIFRNNARVLERSSKDSKPVYYIAAVAPINTPDGNLNSGLDILRGVAQLQDEVVNNSDKFNLVVLIADDANEVSYDDNKKTQAQTVVEALAKKRNLLGVIGHYSSSITKKVLPIYQQNRLVLISGSSTATTLSTERNNPKHVFFRTVPNTQSAAQKLLGFLDKSAHYSKLAVFYNPREEFSRDLYDQFVKLFRDDQIVKLPQSGFDLSNREFNPNEIFEEAEKQGAKALAVFPDRRIDQRSFQNALSLISANKGKFWIVGGNTLYDSKVLKQVGKYAVGRPNAAGGLVVASPFDPDIVETRSFLQTAQVYWRGEVGAHPINSYDAAKVLATVLQQNQPTDRDTVRKVIAENPNFSVIGATGEIHFQGSDRRESIITLFKVLPKCNQKDDLKYAFVPQDVDVSCAD